MSHQKTIKRQEIIELIIFQIELLKLGTYFVTNLQEWLKFFSDHKDVFSIPENDVSDAAKLCVYFTVYFIYFAIASTIFHILVLTSTFKY